MHGDLAHVRVSRMCNGSHVLRVEFKCTASKYQAEGLKSHGRGACVVWQVQERLAFPWLKGGEGEQMSSLMYCPV